MKASGCIVVCVKALLWIGLPFPYLLIKSLNGDKRVSKLFTYLSHHRVSFFSNSAFHDYQIYLRRQQTPATLT